uniref:Secreted protein n=1 Tax=Tetranychus urticae TaxID=32264 RepID=T1JZJ0_TETUR
MLPVQHVLATCFIVALLLCQTQAESGHINVCFYLKVIKISTELIFRHKDVATESLRCSFHADMVRICTQIFNNFVLIE